MSTLSRDTRQERKVKALMRAQKSLEQRFDRIDWEEDVLLPVIQAMKAGKSVLGLDPGAAFDLVLNPAATNLDPAKDTTERPVPDSTGTN